jgi:hypothetical protein
VSATPVNADTYAGICNTYNRYVQTLDAGDFDTTAACFDEDATLTVRGSGEFHGVAELRALWERRRAGPSTIKHIVAGVWVHREDGEEATITAALILIDLSDGRVVATGNSDDVLLRGADGVWRFTEKRVDLAFRAVEAAAGPGGEEQQQ